jgi:malonyl-CoA O-methyltransferase
MHLAAHLVDKKEVRKSFSRAASSYDAAAILQKLVREEMASRMPLMKISPSVVLDAGSGTGQGSVLLHQMYPKAHLISMDFAMGMLKTSQDKTSSVLSKLKKLLGANQPTFLCADIEKMPLLPSSVDLFWSNLALQWCHDIQASFEEIHRVLAPNGLLMFSTLGPDTLYELQSVFPSNDAEVHVNQFIDMHEVGDAIARAGFSGIVMDVDKVVLTYQDVIAMMRDLKSIGAHNVNQGRGRGLKGRGFLKRIATEYEKYREEGRLPATFEVIYGHAWKAPSSRSQSHQNEQVAPVNFYAKR